MSGCPGTRFCEYVMESNNLLVGSWLIFVVLVYVMGQTIRLQMFGFLGGRYVYYMGQIQEFNG